MKIADKHIDAIGQRVELIETALLADGGGEDRYKDSAALTITLARSLLLVDMVPASLDEIEALCEAIMMAGTHAVNLILEDRDGAA